jgi:hypothetical protein
MPEGTGFTAGAPAEVVERAERVSAELSDWAHELITGVREIIARGREAAAIADGDGDAAEVAGAIVEREALARELDATGRVGARAMIAARLLAGMPADGLGEDLVGLGVSEAASYVKHDRAADLSDVVAFEGFADYARSIAETVRVQGAGAALAAAMPGATTEGIMPLAVLTGHGMGHVASPDLATAAIGTAVESITHGARHLDALDDPGREVLAQLLELAARSIRDGVMLDIVGPSDPNGAAQLAPVGDIRTDEAGERRRLVRFALSGAVGDRADGPPSLALYDHDDEDPNGVGGVGGYL